MPQGTIKHHDHATHTGTLVTDAMEELHYDAETFAASGLVELRLGQRVRFELVEDGDVKRVRRLQVVSL